jgi:predicted aspartyl protease
MVRGGAAYGDQNEESTVPFSLHGHLLLVKVRLNDDERERIFFVDTGALTVINKTLADTMHFTSDVHITGKDTSGHNKETRLVEVESLRIGDMEVKGCAAAIFDFALIERAMGLQVDGIIGSNVLRFFTVTIDYKRKIITLSQNKQSRTGGKYRVPFKQDMTVGFAPIVEATIDDKYTVQVIIDTGYDGYFAAVPKSLLAKLKRPTRAVKGISTGGAFGVATEGELARLKSFELGKALRIPNVPVESTKMDKALLGKQFLDKFIVTINYLSNELTLDPIEENVRFKDNIFSTGLRVMYDEQNRAKVIGIEQGSPADKHGIRLEDEVVQINGKPVNSYSVPELIEKLVLNDEIKRLELVIKREGTEQSIVLEKTYVFEQPR